MDLGGVSDLIIISIYSPSFKSIYLGPSKFKYACVFSSLDFTKKLWKQKITIWLIDDLLIPAKIFIILSLEPHRRVGKVFARSAASLLTIYGNNPSCSPWKRRKTKSHAMKENTFGKEKQTFVLVIVHEIICDMLAFSCLPY